MPHIDDNKPFFRMAKDIADKVEEKRLAFNQKRKEKRIGTFAGLEDVIMKRKQEAQNAKRTGY